MYGPHCALLALIATHTKKRADLQRLLCAFPDPEQVALSPGWTVPPRAWAVARRQLAILRACDIQLVPVFSLPRLFWACRPALLALFVRGDARLLSRRAVGIVGARACSPSAALWARRTGERLTEQGVLVVSGGALGIDAAAHQGALAAGGPTLAYLGVAADRVYPRCNRRLFADILETGGALVSELPPMSEGFAGSHALRNRLIAAHSRHLLVAEADEGSGSLSTAAYARTLGTPVWVAPRSAGGRRAGLEILSRNGGAQTLDDVEALLPLAG